MKEWRKEETKDDKQIEKNLERYRSMTTIVRSNKIQFRERYKYTRIRMSKIPFLLVLFLICCRIGYNPSGGIQVQEEGEERRGEESRGVGIFGGLVTTGSITFYIEVEILY